VDLPQKRERERGEKKKSNNFARVGVIGFQVTKEVMKVAAERPLPSDAQVVSVICSCSLSFGL
jgi:hypothetical protein